MRIAQLDDTSFWRATTQSLDWNRIYAMKHKSNNAWLLEVVKRQEREITTLCEIEKVRAR